MTTACTGGFDAARCRASRHPSKSRLSCRVDSGGLGDFCISVDRAQRLRQGQRRHSHQLEQRKSAGELRWHIQDHQVGTWTDSGWLRLSINSIDEPSPEVSASDRLQPNRIACVLRRTQVDIGKKARML